MAQIASNDTMHGIAGFDDRSKTGFDDPINLRIRKMGLYIHRSRQGMNHIA
jgi:hypothetical protein